MITPKVITEMKDPSINFTFRVQAYRKLTRQEMNISLGIWNRQRDKRRSLRNKVVTVISIIGHDD